MLIKEKLKSVTLQTSVDTLDDVICEYKREIDYIYVPIHKNL
ncbi:hypothetical protein bcere0013_35060 [Bacillus cereus BDRD-ST26]|nr:hypothetical protein bcere0013_35060 [Bacillus cereus BDRD-ST26]